MRNLVVTTINSPNKALRVLAEDAHRHHVPFIIVGDTKTPAGFHLPYAEYLSVEEQIRRFPEFCRVLPTKHYARKNVGYLVAMKQGAAEIQETDDDNIPYEEFWELAPDKVEVDAVEAGARCAWLNVYSFFTDTEIWARGFPLEFINMPTVQKFNTRAHVSLALILQGLANENPDVDAVFRLTRRLPVTFEKRKPLFLGRGVWAPFNSQNTIFRQQVFPLLYLPSRCSFRMTDIWRSFVAQRCLWEMEEGVVFHSATVYQERNEHDLLRDFADEIPGYLFNDCIRRALEDCVLGKHDIIRNLWICYQALIENGFLPEDEQPILKAWCAEVEKMLP